MNFIRVGLDIGSVSLKYVVSDNKFNIIDCDYIKHYSEPKNVIIKVLKKILTKHQNFLLAVTGIYSHLITNKLSFKNINEIIAAVEFTKTFYPEIKTIIEIGGEDSKLIVIDNKIKEFHINNLCAAGTGTFLEQQSERLKLSIEEFSELGLKSLNPSKIAGRCSVFAKSDMIHLQQIGTPIEDIIMGLCLSLARNFKATISKNTEIIEPIAFYGGVALNKSVISAFKKIFNINEIFIPKNVLFTNAIGALLLAEKENLFFEFNSKCLENLLTKFKENFFISIHKPLKNLEKETDNYSEKLKIIDIKNIQRKINGYLGIDIGSISTNLVVIDENENLIVKKYLLTKGAPIQAVNEGLKQIEEEFRDKLNIVAVGTTGSGRYLIGEYIGADIIKNEITAQATAAIYIDPEVDTIFEIGGQDSKYISINNGIIVDFEMNKVCAAGTGSFIEEQAEMLGISIKEEFAKYAFLSNNPQPLGNRCTVFIENSIKSLVSKNVKKEDIIAGLAYSIVENYLNKVVLDKPIGKKIFFQGGVAFNKAIVSAFENYLNKKIIVPPHHEVTGAIGMALIAKNFSKSLNNFKSKFKGFSIANKNFKSISFTCSHCSNQCTINKIILDDNSSLYYGGICERYEKNKSIKLSDNLFDLRKKLLTQKLNEFSKNSLKPTIGIPLIFYFHDFLPFWLSFFNKINFNVILSPFTNKHLINLGLEFSNVDHCFPVKVAYGHIIYLLNQEIDCIFLPYFKNLNNKNDEYCNGSVCPLVYTITDLVKTILPQKNKIISPIIDFSNINFLTKQLYESLKRYDISKKLIKEALKEAFFEQNQFNNKLKEIGKNYINLNNEIKIVIVGRSYNSFDCGMNLDIPKKIQRYGIDVIPMDFLPYEDISIKSEWENMYWKSGQKILKAAKFINQNESLYPIFISNFLCGPDSFILKYFKKELKNKPFLHLEIDEHTADAGIITRIEAFLDSINNIKSAKLKKDYNTIGSNGFFFINPTIPNIKRKTIFIPRMNDHAFAIKAAFNFCGYDAEILPEPDLESLKIGQKFVSGKECLPCCITTGDILKKIYSKDFNPNKCAFFMPSGTGPCRFGQYNIFQKILLNQLGFKNVFILSPIQDVQLYDELELYGDKFVKKAWEGIILYDILTKLLLETRPFELNKGETQQLYNFYLNKIYDTLIEKKNNSINQLLKKMKNDFLSIRKSNEKKPIIGIVGEIFIRSNNFSNENLIQRIEELGGQVWLAPIQEWIIYLNHLSLNKTLYEKNYLKTFKCFLVDFFQKKIQHNLEKKFYNFKTIKELSIRQIINYAKEYLSPSFESETILSVGKTIDFINKGVNGIINVMPFGCMPGTISSTILSLITKKYNVPFINLSYDGVESNVNQFKLETFMQTLKNNSY